MARNLIFTEIFDGGASGSVDSNLDTTLTQEGKAADAKAVGDALANKAEKSALSDYAKTTDIVQLDTSLSKQGYAAEAKSTGTRLKTVEDWIEDTGLTHVSRTDLENHNTSNAAHNDLRIELKALADRINAVLDSDDTTLDELSEIVAYIKSNKALIEQVTTTKVNVTDIINNLTSNVTNKPLSAAQGVALKELIDAIIVPTKVSQLTNDANYLTSVPSEYVTETELNAKGYLTQHQSLSGYAKTADHYTKTESDNKYQTKGNYLTSYTETDPTVPSWAKASTKPSYTKSEVGLGNVDNVKQYSASNPPPYPVTKVNNKTGAVTLSASDVGADASGTASSAVSTHNTDTSAHADIREQISQLSSEIVDEIIVMTQDAYSNMTQSDLADLYARGVRMIAVTDLTYTNLVPLSIDTDGSIFNGTGYKDGVRLSSSGGISDLLQANSTTTGFIPFKNTDIIRVKGVITLGAWDNHSCHCYFNLYDSNKAFIGGGSAEIGSAFNSNMASQLSFVYDETTGITTLQIIDPDGNTGAFRAAAKQASYFRLNGVGEGANLIITVNEEI